MNVHFLEASRRALVACLAAAAAVAAVSAVGQTTAAAGEYPFGPDVRGFSPDGAMEPGTIPAARPGLPQQESRGARGPLRTDELQQPRSDPSIRDTDPLTMNGLWEQHMGDVVTHPGGIPINPQQQQ
ncbi:MAG: hypothetical protein PHY45_11140 [Rhodocyclaceae bacterium]|nr:hypothetical protein [Rhodocyclaceae bacterium]